MRQYIPVDFLDRPRRIRFTVNAICDLERKAGGSIVTLFEQSPGFDLIRAMLWAGLKWEDRILTVEATGELMQKYLEGGGALENIVKVIGEALAASGIVAKKEEPDGADPTGGTVTITPGIVNPSKP
jgi:hypothetical protein